MATLTIRNMPVLTGDSAWLSLELPITIQCFR
jgi:hypothetical protein